jgi:hypothetical protein
MVGSGFPSRFGVVDTRHFGVGLAATAQGASVVRIEHLFSL